MVHLLERNVRNLSENDGNDAQGGKKCVNRRTGFIDSEDPKHMLFCRENVQLQHFCRENAQL